MSFSFGGERNMLDCVQFSLRKTRVGAQFSLCLLMFIRCRWRWLWLWAITARTVPFWGHASLWTNLSTIWTAAGQDWDFVSVCASFVITHRTHVDGAERPLCPHAGFLAIRRKLQPGDVWCITASEPPGLCSCLKCYLHVHA
jgi:hypothetical protein